MFRLFLEEGEPAGAVFALQEGDNLAGRSSKARVHLPVPKVSREHAMIIVRGRAVRVRDLESSHGTWVEDRRLKGDEQLELPVGAVLHLGPSLRLRLILGQDDSDETEVARKESSPPRDTTSFSTNSTAAARTAGSTAAQKRATEPTPGLLKGESRVETTPAIKSELISEAKTEFAQTMQAAARDFHETIPVGHEGETGTRAPGTRVPEPGILEELARKELWKYRLRLGAIPSILLLGVLAFLLLSHKQVDEGKLELDRSYDIGTVLAPGGGYDVLYPKNSSTIVKTNQEVLTIITGLGRNRDIPLTITLREETGDKWALQGGARSLGDWVQSNTNCNVGQPRFWFAGDHSGVRIWSADYTSGSERERLAGQVNLFSHGRRLVIQTVEVPENDRARAGNFLDYTYFDFTPEFEDEHWEGQPPPASGSFTTLLDQARADLQREAPLTWAMVDRQLRSALALAVAEKRAPQQTEAARLLKGLRRQERRWYSGQLLQLLNARRSGDLKQTSSLLQGCQAAFSDPDDRRYAEARTWQ